MRKTCQKAQPSVEENGLLNGYDDDATRGSIAIKFYLTHHLGGGKAALGFWSVQIRTLVSMAADSSYRVIMGKKSCQHSSTFIFDMILILATTSITSRTSSKFGQIGPRTLELAAFDCLEKSPKTYNGENVVNTLAPSFLIGSSSFLQVIRTTIRVQLSLKFGQI